MPKLITCGGCGYPHQDDGGGCPNPACFDNPSLSEERKAEMRAAQERRQAEEAERAKIARIRARAMRGSY